MLIPIIELLWQRVAPAGYVSSITSNPLPNTMNKTILLQYGLGDCQVSWLGALTIGRSMNMAMYKGNVRERNETFFGFDFIDPNAITAQSLIEGWDFGSPPVPTDDLPPDKNYDTHEKTRRDSRSISQLDYFFQTGKIKNFCSVNGCRPSTKPE